jgi:hypothetical protein
MTRIGYADRLAALGHLLVLATGHGSVPVELAIGWCGGVGVGASDPCGHHKMISRETGVPHRRPSRSSTKRSATPST